VEIEKICEELECLFRGFMLKEKEKEKKKRANIMLKICEHERVNMRLKCYLCCRKVHARGLIDYNTM
jgi:hypothetical protein